MVEIYFDRSNGLSHAPSSLPMLYPGWIKPLPREIVMITSEEEQSFSENGCIKFSLDSKTNGIKSIRNVENTYWDLYDRFINLDIGQLTHSRIDSGT